MLIADSQRHSEQHFTSQSSIGKRLPTFLNVDVVVVVLDCYLSLGFHFQRLLAASNVASPLLYDIRMPSDDDSFWECNDICFVVN